MEPVIIIQRITTRWTKRGRDASGREQRARLPTAYPLPREAGATLSHFEHHVCRSEPDYAERAEVKLEPPSAAIAAMSVAYTRIDGGLLIEFRWPGDCGAPRRHAQRMTIPPGAWARVRYNGRHVGWDDPWYEDKIVNVAFDLAAGRDAFRGAPLSELDARADLW